LTVLCVTTTVNAKADLYWDEWGVPHIFADNLGDLSYAFGYAHGRDHSALLTRMMFLSVGRAAEVAGFAFQAVDRLLYSQNIVQIAEKFYLLQDEDSVTGFESFAAGFNDYAKEHPEEFTGVFSKVLPVSGLDIFKTNWRVLYTFALSGVGGYSLESLGWPEDIALKLEREKLEGVFYGAYENQDPMEWTEIPKELRHMIGSNAWAINSKSGRSDGKPKLNQNPHLPYLGFFRWYEAQLYCEACGVDVYGANLIGIPNLQIAFNDYLGWTHTVNNIQSYTIYEVPLASADSYYFDGKLLKITEEKSTYKVKITDNRFREETVVNEFTIHGRIVARSTDRILVARIAGLDDVVKRPDAVKQWWAMGKAKSMKEFKDAMRLLQLPMFYTIATSYEDTILHNFNGWVPDRKGVGSRQYWAAPVPGNTSETFWDYIHPWDELPTLENPESGYVQNANEAPWTATFPVFTLDPKNYPDYMAPSVFMNFRSQVSSRLLSENFNITYDDFVRLKHTTLKESALHLVDDLVKAVELYGSTDEVFQASKILASWDRLTEVDSVGAILFETFLRVSGDREDEYAIFLNQWKPEDPLNTPNTIKDPKLAVSYLEGAIAKMKENGWSLDIPWGDVKRLPYGPWKGISTLPGNGCHDCFRNCYYVFNLGLGGDSWVAIIEWDENGAKAKSLIGNGNASPGSRAAAKHVNDQNLLFSEKRLKDVWRKREDILAHLEEYVELRA